MIGVLVSDPPFGIDHSLTWNRSGTQFWLLAVSRDSTP